MSDTLPKAASHTSASRDDAGDGLAEQVDDLLGGIEEVLSVPPPPMTGWSSIPPAKPSVDHLAALAEQLEREREEAAEPDLIDSFARSEAFEQARSASRDPLAIDDAPSISVALTEADFDDEEPTQDWGGQEEAPSLVEAPVPPPVRSAAFLSEPDYLAYVDDPELAAPAMRDEMPSLVDTIDDTPGTLRPSAVSLPRARPARRGPRVPVGYAIGAMAAVTAAVVAYRVGPHSQTTATAGRHVASLVQPAESPTLSAHVVKTPKDEAALPDEQRLLITVTPSNAYLSLRAIDDVEGKKTAGPWPKAFDLEPGEYEVVAFRAGHKPLVRRITIRSGIRPGALDLRLRVDDIYD